MTYYALLSLFLLTGCAPGPPVDPVSARAALANLAVVATDASVTALAVVDGWRHGSISPSEAAHRVRTVRVRLHRARTALHALHVRGELADEARAIHGQAVALETALAGLAAALDDGDVSGVAAWSARIRAIGTCLQGFD